MLLRKGIVGNRDARPAPAQGRMAAPDPKIFKTAQPRPTTKFFICPGLKLDPDLTLLHIKISIK